MGSTLENRYCNLVKIYRGAKEQDLQRVGGIPQGGQTSDLTVFDFDEPSG